MSWLLKLRLGLAAVAIIVWGYAIKVDDPRLRLAGIVILAVVLALRFVGRGNSQGGTAT